MTLLDGRSRSALAPCRSDGDALDAGLATVWMLAFALQRTSKRARTEDEAPVALLYRTCVHWVQRGEACDIAFVHLNRVSKYDPVDCFTARRCRERSLVVVICTLWRQ